MRNHKKKIANLTQINKEIGSLYEYCIAAGLTHDEIVQKAKPLLHPLAKQEWKQRVFLVSQIIILVFAVACALRSDQVSRPLLSKGRQIMIKLLPYWDWTDLYAERCLVKNPLYSQEDYYYVNCQTCEEVYEVDNLTNTSADDISEFYLQRNLPVIVADAMSDWPVMHDTFNILNLTEGFHNLDEEVCMLQTNLGVESHRRVFEKLLGGKMDKWFCHWENCGKVNQKLLRRFYARPYFVPAVVELTDSNWILMSSGYKGQKLKKIEASPSITIMWIAQLRGYNTIQLQPKSPCDQTCNILHNTLEEGEIVLYSPAVWDVSYLPGEGTENLAIAAGGYSTFH